MKKLLIAAAVAAIASVPGVTGLVGNASFAQSIPVQVPAGARTIDDHGRHAEPGHNRGRHVEPGDDRGRHGEPREDHSRGGEPGNANITRSSDEAQAPGSVIAPDGGSGRGAHDDRAAEQ
jgi:hypothetical protein